MAGSGAEPRVGGRAWTRITSLDGGGCRHVTRGCAGAERFGVARSDA